MGEDTKDGLQVDVTYRSETIKEDGDFYLAYRMDHKKELELVGVYDKNSAEELASDKYKDAIKAETLKQSKVMAMFSAGMGGITINEMLSFKIVLVPLPKGTIFNDYKIETL